LMSIEKVDLRLQRNAYNRLFVIMKRLI
jgi:hypothetical protein